jgi:hypothetical protein
MQFDINLFKQVRETKDVEVMHEKAITNPKSLNAINDLKKIAADQGKSLEEIEKLADQAIGGPKPAVEEATVADPITTPTTKPTTKPRTPLAPQPGISPKPKAEVNNDVRLFKQARESRGK